MAGCVISNGSANSLTVASPLARRARIARRVGSAKAEKAASRLCIRYNLYKLVFIVKQNFAPSTENHGNVRENTTETPCLYAIIKSYAQPKPRYIRNNNSMLAYSRTSKLRR